MQVVRGTVVRSSAGRDKGDFQVVLEFDESYAVVCDGKHRPLEQTKRKKLKHLKITNTIVDEENLLTNKLIRKALRPFIEKVNLENILIYLSQCIKTVLKYIQ